MTTRTLLSLSILAILLCIPDVVVAQNRAARPMSEEFFNSMLFTLLSSDANTDVEESRQLDDWNAQTEWNWKYAVQLAMNESKSFPFIVCDDTNIPTLERRQAIVTQGIGLDLDNITTLETVIETVYNTPNITCATALIGGVRAETLGQFIVQPIGFIMKLNAGSLDFVVDEGGKAREFAINFCPGLPWLDLADFALQVLEAITPMIDFLLTVPQIGPFAPDLEQLQQELDANSAYCDAVLLDSVEAEQAGVDYVILRLTTPEENGFSAPDACFLLLAIGLAHSPEICFIERRQEFSGDNSVAEWIGESGVPDETPFKNAGITGEGQVVAVSDSGLDLKSCYFRDRNPIEFGDVVDDSRRKVIQYVDFVDNTDYELGHGTHVCGSIAGRKSEDGVEEMDGFVDGIAYDAKIAFFDVGSTSKRFRIPGATSLLWPGFVAGARIHSASWGSKKTLYYAAQDRDIDRFLYEDDSFLVIQAAGNNGPSPSTVGSPGNAKNTLTVGASSSAEGDLVPGVTPVDSLAGFSSTGPSMDGRIKPDLVAPGFYIVSAAARPYEACDPLNESDLPGPGEGAVAGTLSLQGTSMATPVVSGFAALTRQYFQEGWYGNGTKGGAVEKIVSGTLLKAVLINGAQPLQGYDFDQVDTKQGFGRISLIDSLPLAGENDLIGEYIDNETISDGGINQYDLALAVDSRNLTCSDPDLSITLVWNDPPGYVSCLNCLLNDIDLQVEVTSADGTISVYYPNGRDSKDAVNNVERIRLKASAGDSVLAFVSTSQLESAKQKYALAWVHGCLNKRARTLSASAASFFGHSVSLAALVSATVIGLVEWI